MTTHCLVCSSCRPLSLVKSTQTGVHCLTQVMNSEIYKDVCLSDVDASTSVCSIAGGIPPSLKELGKRLTEERRNLSLFSQPVKTLMYFVTYAIRGLTSCLTYFMAHPLTLYFLLPMLAAYITARISGFSPEIVGTVELWTRYIIWWMGLGVMSSIGLGSGVQTGLLFLFPHMLKVCLAAETCGHTNFSVLGDVWNAQEPFHCGNEPAGQVTFFNLFLKVAFTSMLWGAGTAIGEVPPYLISYSAAKAGQENKAIADLDSEEVAPPQYGLQRLVTSWVTAWQDRMVDFIRHRGFVGIFLLASWPNAAFDLCGIACGAFLMPFWTFFLGTLLGKGVVKVNGQSLVLVTLFMKSSRERLISFIGQLLPEKIPGITMQHTLSQELQLMIDQSIVKFQASVMSTVASEQETELAHLSEKLSSPFQSCQGLHAWAYSLVPTSIGEAWGLVMMMILSCFAVSCVHVLARSCKAEEDNKILLAAVAAESKASYQAIHRRNSSVSSTSSTSSTYSGVSSSLLKRS